MKRPLLISIAGGISVALILSACASTGAASSEPDPSAQAGITQAQAFLDESLKKPDSIGYDSPITGTIPTGKNIAVLETPVAVAQVTNGYREDALKLLGWTQTKIVVGNGPEDAGNAMNQALDSKPAALFQAGYDPNTMTQQLARADQEKVPVIVESIPFVPPTDWPAIKGITRNVDTIDKSAKMSAAYLTVDSGGTANIELFNVPTQTSIVAYTNSLQKYLTQWCPGCSVTVNDFEFTDIGVNLPGQIVSAVQRNPKATYVVLGLGDATVGVVPALQAAGLDSQVKIGGAIPSPENYEALRAGTQAFWAADASPVMAYRETDMMVRLILGEDITVLNHAPEIQQLLTAKNVGDAVFNEKGYWIGYADYEAAFKKQWNIK